MPDPPPPNYMASASFLSNEQRGDPPPIGFHSHFIPHSPDTLYPYANTSYPPEFPMPQIFDTTPVEGSNVTEVLSSQPSERNLAEFATFFSEDYMASADFLSNERCDPPSIGFHSVDISGASWQFCPAAGPYPDNMVRAGVDADGSPIYVGRAFHEGDMVPAKVIPSQQAAYICYGGEEHSKDQIEVMRSGNFVWEFCKSGELSEGAIEIGKTSDGEPLYMGRAMYQGTQTPGKVQTSHGCLYIPFNGEEVAIQEYEMLCLR